MYGELLIGDSGGRKPFLEPYDLMRQAPLVPNREVVTFVRERRLHGRGAGWVDIHILASTVAENLRLWTVDPRLDVLAREFGVAYEPAS